MMHALMASKGTYIAAATDVNPDINVLTWWEIHEQEIPNWAKACKKILLIQSSSATSERVSSLLENSFRDNQACAREDYIEASIMLQYNQRWSHKGNAYTICCLYNPPYKHIKRSYFILGKKMSDLGKKILSIIVELFEHSSKIFWA